jgi:hypothetical protein
MGNGAVAARALNERMNALQDLSWLLRRRLDYWGHMGRAFDEFDWPQCM